jgi:hypothetical protein
MACAVPEPLLALGLWAAIVIGVDFAGHGPARTREEAPSGTHDATDSRAHLQECYPVFDDSGQR